jgi:hypothetical protein
MKDVERNDIVAGIVSYGDCSVDQLCCIRHGNPANANYAASEKGAEAIRVRGSLQLYRSLQSASVSGFGFPIYGDLSDPKPLVATTSTYSIAGMAGADVRAIRTRFVWSTLCLTYRTSGEQYLDALSRSTPSRGSILAIWQRLT